MAAVVITMLVSATGALVWSLSADSGFEPPEMNQARLVVTAHAPVSIDGDADFAGQASSEGWPGDGSSATPFVIGDYSIGSGPPDYGISIVNTSVHFVVSDCLIDNCLREAVWIDNVTNGILTRISLTCPERASGMILNDCANMTVSLNSCTVLPGMGGSGTGLGLFYCVNVTVEGNDCTGGLSMDISHCSECNFSDNSVAGRYISLRVDQTSQCLFENNTCIGGMGNSVQITASSHIVFMDNSFKGGAGYNVWNAASDSNSYLNNTFVGSWYALYLDTSRNITVSGNLWNGSAGNTVYGLDLYLSDDNSVFNNTFIGCINGAIRIEDSVDNTVWNNTFYHNAGSGDTYDPAHVQASDNSAGNHWNSSAGYGNYWCDWQSPDVLAPYGIVDVPYNVTGGGGARDFFPLTTTSAPIPEFDAFPLAVALILGMFVVFVRRSRRR
jgi:hypothetical protein